MSSNIYNTFGNDISYKIVQDTLVAYIDNASVKFPLPEASSSILELIASPKGTPIDPETLSVVQTKLESIGFKKANARAMAKVLMKVAEVQNLSPMTYFDMNENSLKLSVDAYTAMNSLRPSGNKIDLKIPKINSRSKAKLLIKP